MLIQRLHPKKYWQNSDKSDAGIYITNYLENYKNEIIDLQSEPLPTGSAPDWVSEEEYGFQFLLF